MEKRYGCAAYLVNQDESTKWKPVKDNFVAKRGEFTVSMQSHSTIVLGPLGTTRTESAAKGFMRVDHARSCNSFSHVGSMIHELGHVLGMSHEHKRPDAIGKIYLPPPLDEYRGPFLTIHWQNIPEYMRDQYTPDPRAYTGSGSQQDEDPSQGYSDYDYESIMHYSRQVDQVRAGASAQDVFSYCFCFVQSFWHPTRQLMLDLINQHVLHLSSCPNGQQFHNNPNRRFATCKRPEKAFTLICMGLIFTLENLKHVPCSAFMQFNVAAPNTNIRTLRCRGDVFFFLD